MSTGLTGNPGLIPPKSSSQIGESMSKVLQGPKYCENVEGKKSQLSLNQVLSMDESNVELHSKDKTRQC